jgi:hypothetical protein
MLLEVCKAEPDMFKAIEITTGIELAMIEAKYGDLEKGYSEYRAFKARLDALKKDPNTTPRSRAGLQLHS